MGALVQWLCHQGCTDLEVDCRHGCMLQGLAQPGIWAGLCEEHPCQSLDLVGLLRAQTGWLAASRNRKSWAAVTLACGCRACLHGTCIRTLWCVSVCGGASTA